LTAARSETSLLFKLYIDWESHALHNFYYIYI
jgi:hypothetical protein